MIGHDKLCPISCQWGHTTNSCPTPERARYAICAEPNLTDEHKCPIIGCQSAKSKHCAKHGHLKCTNCRGRHSATSAACLDYRQALAIEQFGREEWKEREKAHELRQSMPEKEPDSDGDVEKKPMINIRENNGEGSAVPDIEMDIAEEKCGDNGSGSSPEHL